MSKPHDPRKALGKGLSALLPTRTPTPVPPVAPPAEPANAVLTLSLELIDANPTQPRTEFRPEQLQELANSIRIHGVIQPVIVRQRDQRYELVAGERRWRASKLAGQTTIPAIVQDIAPDNLLEIALIENIQREDLNAIETAIAFDRLAKEFNLSHDEIGRRTGKDRTTITNLVRLLKLPAEIQTLVAERRLSMGHARAILALPTAELQQNVADKTIAQGLSVRNVERLVQTLTEPREPKPETEPAKLDPNVKAAIDELQRVLGTRVRIQAQGANRGKIEIDYYSAEDLDRIYQQIVEN
ncbi:MAG: ParB/RepB/Spo0J family partition protein [Acidobacteria bacterium]|nr:ParB/RepB/Spo0J family partition protein [Acidobacteriota bacterium]